ncbi:hypothetical protein [Micromonospora sp. WMMD737]|uniref:hypothetical protein n=1 Tax=Micromonospora sp. WMMD737 TaxID=3404113 RepID=UPI003B92EC1D
MSSFRPYGSPLGDLCAIPVHLDASIPAGAVVLDADPDKPRHITGIRTADHHTMALTDEQVEQVRDHYRAMDERAGRLLAEWRALERFAAAAVPVPPFQITGF